VPKFVTYCSPPTVSSATRNVRPAPGTGTTKCNEPLDLAVDVTRFASGSPEIDTIIAAVAPDVAGEAKVTSVVGESP
jgi:hypothetical protein